jgi:hypothetical protein
VAFLFVTFDWKRRGKRAAVMAGLVPAIHALLAAKRGDNRHGCK